MRCAPNVLMVGNAGGHQIADPLSSLFCHCHLVADRGPSLVRNRRSRSTGICVQEITPRVNVQGVRQTAATAGAVITAGQLDTLV